MTKPDVIKAAFNCRCKGHPFNCYNHPYDCGCTEKAALSVGKQESVLYKEIYNEAIEEVAKYLELDNWHSLPNIIRSMKK